MSAHTGHDLTYVYDNSVVEQACTINAEGNVEIAAFTPYKVVDVDGDGRIWCNTCDVQVYAGEGGLSKDWECV